MNNQGPSMRKSIVQVMCVLLLLQGYPVLALQETGFTVTPEPSPVGDWVGHWLDQAKRPLGRWHSAWNRAWEPAWASVSAAGEELALDWDVTSWAVAGALGLYGEGGGADTQPPVPQRPSYKVGQRPEPVAFDLAPELIAGKSALQEILLVPGWNLVSLPKERVATDPATVLESIAGAYTHVLSHDNCDAADPWKLYDPENPTESDLATIDPTTGLWIEATLPVDLLPEGELPASTTFSLCSGWNLVGFPAGQARPVRNALQSIEGKYVRVMAYEAYDAKDPWKIYDVEAPSWANDLAELRPGRAYWILATENAELVIWNDGPAPSVSLDTPEDLAVITEPTDVLGTAESPVLKEWTLSYRAIGEDDWVDFASGVVSVVSGKFGVFDPTLLLNGMYEIRLTASDYLGRTVEAEPIAVSVEGNMKIGHFTLSFVDLAIPVSGLDIEVVRTYDSRQRFMKGDFGQGWTLDIHQGSYRNNRPPGDGWQLAKGFLPCDSTLESKSHLTTVRLSEREIYRFALQVVDGKPSTGGGCYAQARFDYVDGPTPGATLKILGNDQVFQETQSSDRVFDVDTLATFEPRQVRLTTRDGRIFDLDLGMGVTRIEDPNGNQLEISANGMFHSAGKSVDFTRDAEGRIKKIADPIGQQIEYDYDASSDLISVTDQGGMTTSFGYSENHYLTDISSGAVAVRNEYDAEGRLVRTIDASGNAIEFNHDLDGERELVTNRLGYTRIYEYDARGRVVREIDELGGITVRTYDGRDKLLTETDPLERTTTFTYTAEGDLKTRTDPLGHVTSFTYNDRGQVTTETDPLNHVTTRTYDEHGNLTKVVDALDHETLFTFDSSGNRLSITNALAEVTSFEYDSSGNLTKTIDALGHESEWAYDSNGKLHSESRTRTLSDGSTETLTHTYIRNELGQAVQILAADGSTTSTAYSALGQVMSQTDQLGRVIHMSYDPSGSLSGIEYPDGSSDQASYDAEGRAVSRTNRSGRTGTFTYDKMGRLLATAAPDGATVKYSYDGAGQRIAIIGTRNNSMTLTYDAAGRRTSVEDPLHNVTTSAYDANGNVIATTDARGHTTHYAYDALNRLTVTTFPDDTTSKVEYDAVGRRIAETDPLGHTTHFGYNSVGQLISVTDALGHITSYAYDELGKRISQTDPNGTTTYFEYSASGLLTTRTLPDGKHDAKTYNSDGTLASYTDFKGQKQTFEYDSNRRLIRRSIAGSPDVTYTYTPTGKRASMTDTRGATFYTYDIRDRLVEKNEPNGNTLTYAYDAQGHPTSLSAHVGDEIFTTSYSYDLFNRLSTVTDSQGEVTTLTYDPNGNLTSLDFPNTVSTSYTYDSLNRTTDLTTESGIGETLQTYTYTLDLAGRRTQVDEYGGYSSVYEYDALNRLVLDRRTDDTNKLVYQRGFSYDPAGNRLLQTIEDATGIQQTIDSSYDKRDRLLSAASSTYDWDANGNLTTKTDGDSTTYGWGQDNRLSNVTLANGTEIRITYDGDGNRVRQEVTLPDGETVSTDYLIDTTGPLSHVVAEVTNAQAVNIYTRAGDRLISVYRPQSNKKRYYHADALGSIRVLSDETGAPTDRYAYTAFGELLEHTGGDPNPYRFAGEPFDPDLALSYNRARWMDAGIGRFTSMDPFPENLRDPQSLSRYTYTQNDPVNRVDPTGFTSAAQVVVVAAITQTLSAIAFSALFAVTVGYLPHGEDAWTNPSATILGFALSGSASSSIVEEAVGPWAMAIPPIDVLGTVEFLLRLDPPNNVDFYWSFGLYVSYSWSSKLASFGTIAGLAFNVPKPSNYLEHFFCTSASVVPGYASGTVCSSPPSEGKPGAYSFTIGADFGGTPLSVKSGWSFYWGGITLGSAAAWLRPIPNTIDSLKHWAYRVYNTLEQNPYLLYGIY